MWKLRGSLDSDLDPLCENEHTWERKYTKWLICSYQKLVGDLVGKAMFSCRHGLDRIKIRHENRTDIQLF